MPDTIQTITAMLHRYCELFDTGQFDEFAAQFTHGQWHRADPGAPATRAWIDEWVLTYDGRDFVFSGWNSDVNQCYFVRLINGPDQVATIR